MQGASVQSGGVSFPQHVPVWSRKTAEAALNIVIVDDQTSARTMLRHILEDISPELEVFDFGDPEHALRWCDDHRPDLLLLTGDLTENGDGTSYAQLAAATNRFANVLKSMGVKRGDTVTLYMGRVPELPIAMLATAKIGAIHSVVYGGFSEQALADRSLSLHYQPQVLSSAPGTLHGVEALARWQHPEWGMVPPSRFIPVAEEAGLIHELTLWLLDEACAQLSAWRAAGHSVPCVAVNLSGRSFHQAEFAQQVCDALERHGLRTNDVLLEITESVMMDARPVTLANIEALHHKGFKLSLDDFGTGYSSLSYLHRLPISELKLDMAFVQDLTTSPTARALTVSVLSIAHSLGMVVVAEGVETTGQQQWLQAHGCPVMQGYLFGRPMPPDELEAWLCAPARGLS